MVLMVMLLQIIDHNEIWHVDNLLIVHKRSVYNIYKINVLETYLHLTSAGCAQRKLNFADVLSSGY